MNVEETGRLLAKVAGYDNRTVGDTNILAWHEALSDVDYRDALQAVAVHFRESTDYLMPVHVRRGAEQIDRERRRVEREEAEAQQALESAEARRFTAAEIGHAAALIAELREKLPPGDPAKLRGEHWLATHAVGQLRDCTRPVKTPSAPAVPNPYYDPAAAARLAEMNVRAGLPGWDVQAERRAAGLPEHPDDAPGAESDDAPAPESSTP